MSVRVVLVAVACGLLAAGCGTSSGLQVENGGTTTPIVKPAGPQPRVDGLDAVAFPSTSRGWAAGKGAIIATTDGGATWTQQYKGRADIRSLVFADDLHGWAVASDSLLRTADGGATWSPAGEPEGLVLTSVDFTSAEEGWGIALPADARSAHRSSAPLVTHQRRRRRAGRSSSRMSPTRSARREASSSPARDRRCSTRPTAGRRGAPCWTS